MKLARQRGLSAILTLKAAGSAWRRPTLAPSVQVFAAIQQLEEVVEPAAAYFQAAAVF